MDYNATSYNNLAIVRNALKSKNNLTIISNDNGIAYFDRMLKMLRDNGCFESDAEYKFRNKFHFSRNNTTLDKHVKTFRTNDEFSNWEDIYKKLKGKNMHFDTIIQNPPYNGSLHLDFFEKGIDLLTDNGKMVIIEPATWLINVRKNGKAKLYDSIKEKTNGHIKSVVIENLNKEFSTGLFVPFATTTIDMSETFDTIDFVCCGERKVVNSIYDCNLVGDYKTIWGILEKCQKFGDMMKNHITKENMGEGVYYVKYAEITPKGGLGITCCCNGAGMYVDNAYGNNIYYVNGYNRAFFDNAYHGTLNEISDTPHNTVQRGGAIGSHELSNKIADNIYGSKEELEKWKHFIFNNKLPLFLNIVLTIDQHNNSKEFLPWLVDRQYTDEEINQMFGFTDEEIKLINKTIEKYERNSPWFKRYMCGKDSVSDEEVNNFIEQLNKKYE